MPRKAGVAIPPIKGIQGVKMPKGWGFTETTLRARGLPEVRQPSRFEPAGDPPEDFPGTRPEWAAYWGLNQNGLHEGEDFTFQGRTPGVERSYYSTLDFVVTDYGIGLEVQGEFWHLGLGNERIANDALRKAMFAAQGLLIISIRESQVLQDPKYIVAEALKGIDLSERGY